MALSQRELALQMLAQLRMLDPSVSAEVGTPERKILDTVAQALADAQVDLTQLSGALDVDSKASAELDRFLALFGFGRQSAVSASGYVTFGRTVASNLDIQIPARTQVMAPGPVLINAPNDFINNVIYETTFAATLLAGQTSVIVPIAAALSGSTGNVSAGAVTLFVGTPIYGITEITNEVPVTGGVDAETDEQLKVRFKNTVFRNLAGTQDQYLALAASAKYTTKANVVGPISRYREYIQVPPVDDASAYNVNPESGTAETGNGLVNEWTTALSDVGYSKHTYTEVPTFVSNGQTGVSLTFWREEIDWRLNTSVVDKDRGDTYRFHTADVYPQIGLNPSHPDATYRPNVTFLSVYEEENDAVTAVRPGEVVLFEHSYLSTASRNEFDQNITNCIDLFIDGANEIPASTVIAAPGSSLATAFINSPTSRYHFANYRLWGEPDIPAATWPSGEVPAPGGTWVSNTYLFLPLFWQPITGLPESILIQDGVDEALFFLGEHYWQVYDNTDLFGTIRARDGICWNRELPGATSVNGPRTAKALKNFTNINLGITIENYIYDRNVIDLQATVDTSKQVTTDLLVHRARKRYLKFDISVMYQGGANTQATNALISTNVERYLQSLYFGTVIQLSDVLQAIHAVPGVDNVRWSSDIPGNADLERAYETNRTGVPRAGELIFATDFFTKDDELPVLAEEISDDDATAVAQRQFQAIPGFIIRTRAQNTFTRA